MSTEKTIEQLLRMYGQAYLETLIRGSKIGRRIAGLQSLARLLSPLAVIEEPGVRITFIDASSVSAAPPRFLGCKSNKITVCMWEGHVSFKARYFTSKEPEEVLDHPLKYPFFFTHVFPRLSLQTHVSRRWKHPPIPVLQLGPATWRLPTFFYIPNPDLEYQVSRKVRGKPYYKPIVIDWGAFNPRYVIRLGVIRDTWEKLTLGKHYLRRAGMFTRGGRPAPGRERDKLRGLCLIAQFICILSGALSYRMLTDILGFGSKRSTVNLIKEINARTPYKIGYSTKIDRLTHSAYIVCFKTPRRGEPGCPPPGTEERMKQQTLLKWLTSG